MEKNMKYLLRKIGMDVPDFSSAAIEGLRISEAVVEKYIQEALRDGVIEIAEDRKCGYRLAGQVYYEKVSLIEGFPEEDRIFETCIAKYLKPTCNEAALRIWQYACAEMLNNAIDHSCGKELHIKVYVNCLNTKVIIVDDGVGVFHTLLEYMKQHGWENPCVEDAILELHKGKITSNAACHSGEGIFFSSKMMDEFCLWSFANIFEAGNNKKMKIEHSHLLAYASRINDIGTMVYMCLDNDTERKITEVFDMYTNVDGGFVKTSIPIKELCINGGPVARSQARRVCNRLEAFEEVILDFDDVEYIGQGFADELFRVYAGAHPEVILRPVNMSAEVKKMIYHISGGQTVGNIRWA